LIDDTHDLVTNRRAIIVHSALSPRTVRCNENARMETCAHRIDGCKGCPCVRASLIDRSAKHYGLTGETGMTDAGYNMAVYACEDHLLMRLEG
ncbi:MAG: hypothetical protein ACI8ZW_001934, partial [Yoonia sp.]